MKQEQQVANLELSRKLKSLGVKQESAFYYDVAGKVHLITDGRKSYHLTAAFTVAELGEMLPKNYSSIRPLEADTWHCYRYHPSQIQGSTEAITEADARAKMLIYLIEKGIVKVAR